MSPPGQQTAVNGFTFWLLSIVVTTLYVLWAVLPEWVLHTLHITYYPDKYWALAMPACLIACLVYYFVAHVALVFLVTPPLDDGQCITDPDRRMEANIRLSGLNEDQTRVPAFTDIPVNVVSQLLFQPWKDEK